VTAVSIANTHSGDLSRLPLMLLFNQRDIFGVLRGQEQDVRRHIQELNKNSALSASEQDLIDGLVEKFWLSVPVLKEDDIRTEYDEVHVDVSSDPRRIIIDRSGPFHVPGTRVVIRVPFEGEAVFFTIQPQVFGYSVSNAEIAEGELLLTYIRTDHDVEPLTRAEAIKRECGQALSNIKQCLASLRMSAEEFNSKLEGLVASLLKQRKQKLLADAGMAEAIGWPLKKREGMPATYAVPVKRRVPKINQIKAVGAFKPEPTLSASDYEEILRIMKNMALVMERSPRAFVDMGEEMLRWHFLVQLNGVYEGQATGETFNFQGKTDVLIRVDGKNVFIAECKFWNGEKVFLETIDQLLEKYLSWRDTKAAIVVFNTKSNFSGVLDKIAEAVPKHSKFKRDLGKSDETTFRYVFAQPNDANREIKLTVLAFDIPKAANAKP
jgi:hypothetical protein